MNEFIRKRETWLKEVAEKCDNFASRNDEFPDFYVFQSRSDIYNPDLLIIGANTGNAITYRQIKKIKKIDKRTWLDLGYGSNQYIENENNPEWRINKPILKMFQSKNARKALENSVIMNVIYFNTKSVSDLKKHNVEIKEIKNFCIKKTKEFIDIIKPKNILFIGFDAPKWMSVKYDYIKDAVLRKDDRNFLIARTIYNSVPCFIIHHTSNKRGGFNSGESIEMKELYFREYFERI